MSAPRSLADAIRAMSTDQVISLLEARPDLQHPRPTSLGELAERAGTTASTRLAIDGLTAWDRRVAVALAADGDGVTLRRLAALLQAERADVDRAATILRNRALAWGDARSVHLTTAARTVLGPFPAGLAPASATPMSDAEIDAALAEGGPEVRALLERLVWELPVGQVRDADRRGSGDSPADRALALKLLRPREAHTVILPREVSLRLRGGRLFEHPVPAQPPAWGVASDDPDTLRRLDRAGLGAAFELLRQMELVVDEMASRTMRPLASGGLARKDAARLFSLVGSERAGTFVLQLAHAARLIGPTPQAWLPTAQFDRWVALDDWHRWRELRWGSWTRIDAWPGSAHVLGAPQSGWATRLRGMVLQQIRPASPGTPIDAAHLAERISWSWPALHSEELPDLCAVAVGELEQLGVIAVGRRTSLLDATDDPGFPPHGEHIIVQGDLTAISPGPLMREVATTLALMTDRESSGGAGVHRFSPTSIRRAFDAGWSADGVREWLLQHSQTGVPQALDYLIDDVARRHGSVQVSAVSSVVNIDDPALVEALLADPRARSLGLRRIAGGVLGALAEPDEVVEVLRDLGHAPVARDASGAPALAPARRRAPAPPATPASERLNHASLHQLAEELRARADPAVHARGTDDALEVLARHEGSPTWLEVDHVADDGTPRTTLARVVALLPGAVRLAPREGSTLTLPRARVVGVRVPRRLGGQSAESD